MCFLVIALTVVVAATTFARGARSGSASTRNYISDAKDWVKDIKKLDGTFQRAIDAMEGAYKSLDSLPTGGEINELGKKHVKLLEDIIKLASSIVQADATNNTFLERVQAALYKMLDALKNNDATQCITEHVQKEHMVVAFSYPWGVSVECMLDWDCYYCVDRVQKTSNFFYLAVLKSALSALTESELEDMLGVLQVSLMDVLQEQEEEERVQQVMSLQSAMSQSWAMPADAEQLLFAEVSARAGGMLGDIKDYLQSILSRAEKLVDLANSIPPFTELRNHMEDLTKQFENKYKEIVTPEYLISLLPGGLFGTVANAMKSVPCLSKETLEGGLLFGLGLSSGGPSLTIQCRRMSCYTCVADSTVSIDPFRGVTNRVVEELSATIRDAVRKMMMMSSQEGLVENEDVDEDEVQQRLLQEETDLLELQATNSGFSITSALGINKIRDDLKDAFKGPSSSSSEIKKLEEQHENAKHYLSYCMTHFSDALLRFLPTVIEKAFSPLSFFGEWTKMYASNMITAIQENLEESESSCLLAELDAHHTSGGSSVGLTFVAGLDMKLTPSLSFVCNRGSCFQCLETVRKELLDSFGESLEKAVSVSQFQLLQMMESAQYQVLEEEEDTDLEGADLLDDFKKGFNSAVKYGEKLTNGVKKEIKGMAKEIEEQAKKASNLAKINKEINNLLVQIGHDWWWKNLSMHSTSSLIAGIPSPKIKIGLWHNFSELSLAQALKIKKEMNRIQSFFTGVREMVNNMPADHCVRKLVDGGYIAIAFKVAIPTEVQVIGNIMGVHHCLESPDGKAFTRAVVDLFKK